MQIHTMNLNQLFITLLEINVILHCSFCVKKTQNLDQDACYYWKNITDDVKQEGEHVMSFLNGHHLPSLGIDIFSDAKNVRFLERKNDGCGQVEVYFENRWSKICNDGLSETEPDVVCRTLGYKGFQSYCSPSCSGDTNPNKIERIHCKGNETSISNCTIKPNVTMCSCLWLLCEPERFLYVDSSSAPVDGTSVRASLQSISFNRQLESVQHKLSVSSLTNASSFNVTVKVADVRNMTEKTFLYKGQRIPQILRWEQYEIPLEVPQNNFAIEVTFQMSPGSFFALKTSDFLQKKENTSNYAHVCPSNCFACGDGDCTPYTNVCDFKLDCPNGQDESKCDWPSRCSFEEDCEWTSGIGIAWLLSNSSAKNKDLPTIDHTFGNETGTYKYIWNDGLYSGSTTLTSPPYPPPPSAVLNPSSPLYGACAVRFFLIMPNKRPLKTEIINDCDGSIQTSMDNPVEVFDINWNYLQISLYNITQRYRIQISIKTKKMGWDYIAIDDISLSPYCFNTPETTCLENQFACGDGTCIPLQNVCDLKPDCKNHHDETICGIIPSQLRCTFDKDEDDCMWKAYTNLTLYSRRSKRGQNYVNDSDKYAHITNENEWKNITLISAEYPPLPPEVSNTSSPFYRACKIGFSLKTHGELLTNVKLRKSCDKSDIEGIFLDLTNYTDKDWHRMELELVNITYRYRVEISLRRNSRSQAAYMGIDDIFLTPYCFTIKGIQQCNSEWKKYYIEQDCIFKEENDTENIQELEFSFKPCGAIGSSGPTQAQCDAFYEDTNIKVTVQPTAKMQGIQIWKVPKNGTYDISAFGAGGGMGIFKRKYSRGSYVSGKVNLTVGQELYILVGQKGTSACDIAKDRPYKIIREYCDNGQNKEEMEDFIKKNGGGGGGGGGGSYIFLNQDDTFIPLLVAGGGGGGNAFGLDPSDIDNGNTYPDNTNISSIHKGLAQLLPGQGGGWNSSAQYLQDGLSLLDGATGGKSCEGPFKNLSKSITGGFGGGGGGCISGGGGGGYLGGQVAGNHLGNGKSGASFHHSSVSQQVFHENVNSEEGYVEILFSINCRCEYSCHISDVDSLEYTCKCPLGKVLAHDGHRCIAKGNILPSTEEEMPVGYLTIIIILSGAVVTTVTITAVICLYKHHEKKKHLKSIKLELMSSSQSYRIQTSTANGLLTSHTVLTSNMMAEYNPNYDFVGAKFPEQHLHKLDRTKLRLERILGQGAFGEVYKGYLALFPEVNSELAVAVKTLPVYSTEQSENDFLMEAIIMNKFNHPNIVKFLGVCFESHPRYIVLELLSGGDLKTFLREMRPKFGETCQLCMIDLLKLVIDIGKGCLHLQECHFIHRDIAARNCLLTTKGPDRIAKIADFGMARDIYRNDYYKKAGKAMLPIKWMPPEAFLDGVFTAKTDVWSFGVLMWEVFSMGYIPYPGMTNHDVMDFVQRGGRLTRPEHCPPPLFQLMAICWASIPETRPNFSEIIEHLKRCSQDPEVLSIKISHLNKYQVLDNDSGVVPPSFLLKPLQSPLPDETSFAFTKSMQGSESKEPLLSANQNEESCGGKTNFSKSEGICMNPELAPLIVNLPKQSNGSVKSKKGGSSPLIVRITSMSRSPSNKSAFSHGSSSKGSQMSLNNVVSDSVQVMDNSVQTTSVSDSAQELKRNNSMPKPQASSISQCDMCTMTPLGFLKTKPLNNKTTENLPKTERKK